MQKEKFQFAYTNPIHNRPTGGNSSPGFGATTRCRVELVRNSPQASANPMSDFGGNGTDSRRLQLQGPAERRTAKDSAKQSQNPSRATEAIEQEEQVRELPPAIAVGFRHEWEINRVAVDSRPWLWLSGARNAHLLSETLAGGRGRSSRLARSLFYLKLLHSIILEGLCIFSQVTVISLCGPRFRPRLGPAQMDRSG